MVSKNVAQRSRVDFPEPEGPIMDTTSPSSTKRLISFNTCKSPKDFSMFFISNSFTVLPLL